MAEQSTVVLSAVESTTNLSERMNKWSFFIDHSLQEISRECIEDSIPCMKDSNLFMKNDWKTHYALNSKGGRALTKIKHSLGTITKTTFEMTSRKQKEADVKTSDSCTNLEKTGILSKMRGCISLLNTETSKKTHNKEQPEYHSIASTTQRREEFHKNEGEKLRVLFDFRAREENDLNVVRGDQVTVLNRNDRDWWWVRVDNRWREEGNISTEGFIPSRYLWPCACPVCDSFVLQRIQQVDTSTKKGISEGKSCLERNREQTENEENKNLADTLSQCESCMGSRKVDIIRTLNKKCWQ